MYPALGLLSHHIDEMGEVHGLHLLHLLQSMKSGNHSFDYEFSVKCSNEVLWRPFDIQGEQNSTRTQKDLHISTIRYPLSHDTL